MDEIKQKLVDNIMNGKLTKELKIPELDEIKDIYFDGISKYNELHDKPSQYKRAILEVNGKYPSNELERKSFEARIIKDLISTLEEPDLNSSRVHLESITEIPESENRVFVQFLLMNGDYGKKTPHDILMTLKEKYSANNEGNDFTKKYDISNLIFGEPSIILDKEDVELMQTMSVEIEETKPIDESTFIELGPRKYRRVANFGCDIMLEDLRYGKITSQTPLVKECEEEAEKYFRGYSSRMESESKTPQGEPESPGGETIEEKSTSKPTLEFKSDFLDKELSERLTSEGIKEPEKKEEGEETEEGKEDEPGIMSELKGIFD